MEISTLLLYSLWLIVLISPIQIKINLYRGMKSEFYHIKVKLLYGLIKFKLNLPSLINKISFIISKKKPDVNMTIQNAKRFKHLADLVLNSITIDKLVVTGKIGMKDAYYTAIITGVVHSFLGYLRRFCSKIKGGKRSEPYFDIEPYYNFNCLYFKLECIIHLHLVYIIYITLMFIFGELKRGINNWKIIQSKA